MTNEEIEELIKETKSDIIKVEAYRTMVDAVTDRKNTLRIKGEHIGSMLDLIGSRTESELKLIEIIEDLLKKESNNVKRPRINNKRSNRYK